MAGAKLVALLVVLAGCGSAPDYTMGHVDVWDDVGVSRELVRRALAAVADEGAKHDPELHGARI